MFVYDFNRVAATDGYFFSDEVASRSEFQDWVIFSKIVLGYWGDHL